MRTSTFVTPYLVALVALLSSCARQTLTKRLVKSEQDSFQNETFIRYTRERLPPKTTSPFAQEIFNCYEGDYSQTYRSLKSQLSDNLKNPEYWNTYGLCYYLEKDYPKADYFFQLALSYTNNRYQPALSNFAMSQYQQGHTSQALELFHKLVKQSPKLRVPKFNLAQIYLEYDQLTLAIDLLNQLERAQAGDPDVLIALGTSHLLNNNLGQANFYFGKIDVTRSQHLDMIFFKALMAFEQKKWKEAVDLIESHSFTRTLALKRFAKHVLKISKEQLVAIELQEKKVKKKEAKTAELKESKAKS